MNDMRRVRGAILAACTLVLFGEYAYAAPTVQEVSGTFDHKGTIAIKGSDFGAKEKAAPLVWDDCSGSRLLDKWSGYWPNKTPEFDTAYRSPQRGISPPHNRVNRYIAGAHGKSLGYDAGYNVIFWKNIESPRFVYASWYQRADDAWVFGGDNNYKTFAYSKCCSPYEMPNNWYTGYAPPKPSNRTEIPSWGPNDDGQSLKNPDVNGHRFFWNPGVNPMSGQWAKVEVAVKVTTQDDGYIKVWENGRIVIDYLGPTDKYPGTSRSVGIGGYARMSNQPNNWRYFADAYLDTSLARVVLANKPSLSQANIIENQIPSAWSNDLITASVNLGKFKAGETAYLVVVDGAGRVSPGFEVKAGGTGTGKVPSPPTNVRTE